MGVPSAKAPVGQSTASPRPAKKPELWAFRFRPSRGIWDLIVLCIYNYRKSEGNLKEIALRIVIFGTGTI
ncbi:hypothetical protein HJ01_03122 [Flavobacterium frigoris PS1]|uniref:Uncharacterized protein n=1 Tax=Flavobacterium frigoris (strain PS1) TaxID=1086011 RepID=H7FVC4_FLAFP|nr:hypothetical protein HJ01_03122 [Flavobacterium frigoris PS1]